MQRLVTVTLAIAFGMAGAAAFAQPAPEAKPAKPKPAAKAAPQPATPRQELKSEAKGLALGTETAETISATQLDIAARVLTGKAECENSQTIDVDAVPEQPGVFKVNYKQAVYLMVPEETSTGAVRLFNRRTGIVWLQIPVKSMLLDSREGRRLVDYCTHAEQRAAVAASTGAASSVAAKAITSPAPAAPRK